jgi:hypothetical protein
MNLITCYSNGEDNSKERKLNEKSSEYTHLEELCIKLINTIKLKFKSFAITILSP